MQRRCGSELTPRELGTTLSLGSTMLCFSGKPGKFRAGWMASFAAGALCLGAPSGRCQDSGDQGMMIRGDRAEISVTVRDSSGAILTAPALVKLYENGVPTDQMSTSH